MKTINIKKLTLIIMTGFVLSTSGCGEKKISSVNTKVEQSTPSKEVESGEEKQDNIKTPKTTISVNEDILTNDERVVNEFDKSSKQIDELLNNINKEEIKNAIIDKFISLTDFVFYDGEINGMTFDELKEETKEKIINIYYNIDSKLENRFPSYKEKVTDKYVNIKDKIKNVIEDKRNNLSDDTKTKLDSLKENLINTGKDLKDTATGIYYDTKIDDVVDSAKDKAIDIYNSGKTKVKTWYEGLKNNR